MPLLDQLKDHILIVVISAGAACAGTAWKVEDELVVKPREYTIAQKEDVIKQREADIAKLTQKIKELGETPITTKDQQIVKLDQKVKELDETLGKLRAPDSDQPKREHNRIVLQLLDHDWDGNWTYTLPDNNSVYGMKLQFKGPAAAPIVRMFNRPYGTWTEWVNVDETDGEVKFSLGPNLFVLKLVGDSLTGEVDQGNKKVADVSFTKVTGAGR